MNQQLLFSEPALMKLKQITILTVCLFLPASSIFSPEVVEFPRYPLKNGDFCFALSLTLSQLKVDAEKTPRHASITRQARNDATMLRSMYSTMVRQSTWKALKTTERITDVPKEN